MLPVEPKKGALKLIRWGTLGARTFTTLKQTTPALRMADMGVPVRHVGRMPHAATAAEVLVQKGH
jgi:hypothetical protein